MKATPTRKPWRKVLYENREYPDNYTDPSFLKELQTNLHVRIYSYGEAIAGITVLNNQISCITGFLITFHLMYSGGVSPTAVLLPSCLVAAFGYLWHRGRTLSFALLLDDSKTVFLVLLVGFIFAPLLHTLTEAISTDTIFTMTLFVMLLNLVFFDYGLDVAMVSKAISLNAAIFGAICLSSRLATSFHAFVLLVEAVIFFVLYSIMVAASWHPFCLLPIFIACCVSLYHISLVALTVYVVVIFCINFVFTGIFVLKQQHKFNIHGPWDEAIVEENTDTNMEKKL